MKKSEFELIADIRKRFPVKNKKTIGIGDDCAFIDGKTLITTDALVDGTHFLSDKTDFADLGYKSMAVNISDIAAMGGFPTYVLITMGIPSGLSDEKINDFLTGVSDIREIYGFELIGGDTVRADKLFISVTMLGLPFDYPVYRNGAKAKDFIYITGTVGDAAIGLKQIKNELKYPVKDEEYFITRHYIPSPRVKLMEHLLKHYRIHSCIDISDGVLADLQHISDESDMGFFLEMNELPLSVEQIGESIDTDNRYFYELGLTGGEDYELLFTSPDEIDTLKILEQTGVLVTPVGYMSPDISAVRFYEQKIDIDTLNRGFKHF